VRLLELRFDEFELTLPPFFEQLLLVEARAELRRARAQRSEALLLRSHLKYSKMLGGASQTVSKIRVKCNGT
jgi:hypothetical protein